MSETPIELLQGGMLSKSDARALRKLIGAQTFAEWIDGDQTHPYRVRDQRLVGAMVLRHRAIVTARQLARVAPWLLIAEPRR